MKKYIYLDWNVYQHMKHEKIIDEKFINGLKFKKLIKKLSLKYIFPYSVVHLEDLSASKNEKYILEDLKFIKQISKDYILGWIEDKRIVVQKNYKNIEDVFNQVRVNIENELKQELNLEFMTNNSYAIEVNQMDNDELLKPLIEDNGGTLNNSVFLDLINMMYKNIDSPDFYKKFREQVYNLKKKFNNRPNTVISKDSEHFKEIEPFLDFIIENNIENMKNNFQEMLIADKKRKFENLTIGNKIELAYSLLDYNQHFRDKIDKKNRPTNMYKDVKHLIFASEAKYYVTQDETTYEKSKFVSEALGLNVKVVKMNEFINKFI